MTDTTRPTGAQPAETRSDPMPAWPAAALHAALERRDAPPGVGDPLPLFWRWLYFLNAEPPSRLGRDGHPAQGVGLIPDVGLPRRMWAGGRIDRRRAPLLGRPAETTSRIASIERKSGRSGPLCFVTLRHELSDADGLLEIEEQDLVYREDPQAAPKPTSPQDRPANENAPPAPTPTWRRDWRADATLLFRYSALTFNGHRIHYDRPYATAVEGYDGLVVHGPLLATLMLELVRDEAPDVDVARFSFRGLAPITQNTAADGSYDAAFAVCGRPTETGAELWVERNDGTVAMKGAADVA